MDASTSTRKIPRLRTYTVTVMNGKFSAKGTTCSEAAINNLVARVHLDRLDYSDLENKRKYTAGNLYKQAIKRKMSLLLEKNAKRRRFNMNPVEKRKIVFKANNKIKVKPLTNNSVMVKSINKKLSSTQSGDHSKINAQFNGDKHPILYTSPRIRRPNPKFQDFITSTSHIRTTTNPPEKLIKENVDSTKSKHSFILPNNASLISDIDPLDLLHTKQTSQPKADDVVRSFLPIIDKPKVHYDSDSDMETESSAKYPNPTKNIEQLTLPMPEISEKENEKNNMPMSLQLIASNTSDAATKVNVIAATTNQMKLSHNTPVIISSHSMTPLLISPNLIKNSTSMPIIIATKFIPNLTPIASQEIKAKETTTVNNVTSEKLNQNNKTKSIIVTRGSRSKKKIVTVEVPKKKDDIRYYLVESEGGASNRTKAPKANDVDFNKLVRTLKSVKLPAANWKIRIVVSRQQTITEVTFTNKEANERCVKFSRIFTGYVITFGKSIVKLVGAPNKISSFNDVTILLDIIHHLSGNDPVLQYISDKDK